MCLTEEGKIDNFRVPSTCKSVLSVTYSSTAVRSLTNSLSSWSAYLLLSHLQVSLPFVHSFFRSLADISTNSGIGADRLFCLNTSFSNRRVLTTSLASLLPNRFLYLEIIFFSITTSVYRSMWDMAAKAFSLNLCPQPFESFPSARKSEHSYFADAKVCHRRPMSRCTKPLNA